MDDTFYRLGEGPYLNAQGRARRVARAIEGELTPCQRRAICGKYMEGKTVTQLARELGVNKSTVSRTLKRGEKRLKRSLGY